MNCNDLSTSIAADGQSRTVGPHGEVAVHFAGIEGLKKPLAFIYPKLRICMECGDAKFIVPEKELKVLATGVPVDGTIVVIEGGELP